MRKEFVLFIIVLFSIVSIGQGQNLIISDTVYKKGIYRTFEEFRFNKPSIDLDYKIVSKKSGYGLFGAEGSIPVYRLDVDKKVGKSIGKIFGFSDGRNIYINPSFPELSPQTDFSKIEFIREYCYFENIQITRISNGSHTTETKSLSKKLIDVVRVKGITLDKYTLRELIADDKDLLEEFNNESQKNKKLKEYVIRYANKS